jgi:uracil-DNA glycosylase family 4
MNPKFAKPPGCVDCTLEHRGLGYVPADGPPGAHLTFLAEALGAEEVITGKPLMGAAGGAHTRILYRAGIARESTVADNCIRCMPPGMWFDEKAPWYYPALSHCAQYRGATLAAVPRDAVVVTLGGVALRTLLNLHAVDGVRVDEFHHTVNRSLDDRYWIVPTFHPAFLQRGAMNLLEVVTSAYRLADRVATQGFVRTPSTLVVDPAPEFVGRWINDHLERVRLDPDGTHLSLDTEFEKKPADESTIDVQATATSPLKRINLANDATTGITYPYSGPYIALTECLLAGMAALHGICWTWFKYADWDHLRAAGHTLDGIVCYDGAVAWHFLQSDLPMGLGFVAPLASDFGPWKHWAADKEKEGPYAAADAVQNWRTCLWACKALIAAGTWDVFVDDWHERDEYVLRPSKLMGVPVDRPALEAFHQELQGKQTVILGTIKTLGAQGTLRPKNGYAKKPAGRNGEDPTPPKSILGSTSKRKSEAKDVYTQEAITLVERLVEAEVRVCTTCGTESVTATHRCKRPPARRARRKYDADALGVDRSNRDGREAGRGHPPVDSPSVQPDGPADAGRGQPVLRVERRPVRRYFWSLPFNPDSWQQILVYIGHAGHTPGTHRKTRQPTTDAASLKKLAADTGDPLYSAVLDYRAVQKVDSTYAVGSLVRLDADNRLHPEITPRPSMMRDSSIGPNLQNVIADKDNTKTLAAGFRRCIVARDGVPAIITSEELTAWEVRWR